MISRLVIILSLFLICEANAQSVWISTHSWKTALVQKDTLDYFENAYNPGIPEVGDTIYNRGGGILFIDNNRLYPWFGTRHNSEHPYSTEVSINNDSISFTHHRDTYTGIIRIDSMITWTSSDYIAYTTYYRKITQSALDPNVHLSRLIGGTAWELHYDNDKYKLLLHDDSKMTIQTSSDSISYSTEGEYKIGELGGHMFLSIYSSNLNRYTKRELHPKGPIRLVNLRNEMSYEGLVYLYDSVNGPFTKQVLIKPSQYELSQKTISNIKKKLIGKWVTEIEPYKNTNRYREDLFKNNPIHFSLEFKDSMEYEIIQYCDDIKNKAILGKRNESGTWSLGPSGDYLVFKKIQPIPGKIVLLDKKELILDCEISTQVNNHKMYTRIRMRKEK